MDHDRTTALGGACDGSTGTILAGAGGRLNALRYATAAPSAAVALAAEPRPARVVGATPSSVRTHDWHRLRPARRGPERSVAPADHGSRPMPARAHRPCSAVLGSFADRMIVGRRR